MFDFLTSGLFLTTLAFLQNVSFSMVSRARNRNNQTYHILASIGSNTIWFLTFRELILADMPWHLLPFYMLGTVTGSVWGAKLSMWVENKLGASTDGHLK